MSFWTYDIRKKICSTVFMCNCYTKKERLSKIAAYSFLFPNFTNWLYGYFEHFNKSWETARQSQGFLWSLCQDESQIASLFFPTKLSLLSISTSQV